MRYQIVYMPFLIITICLLSISCERQKSISQICSESPNFCTDLNQDKWCQKEKASVIKIREKLKNTNQDHQRYDLLVNFRKYKSCIELVTYIEPKKNLTLRTTRVDGLITANNEIKRLESETESSEDPYILLYRWNYNKSQEAKEKFLALEGNKQLDKPLFQRALALYYANFDINHSINLFKKAISLYNENDPYPADTFETMSTMQFKAGEYEQAYIWALIAKSMGNKEVHEQMIKRYQKFTKEQIEDIETKAEHIIEQIEDYNYPSP